MSFPSNGGAESLIQASPFHLSSSSPHFLKGTQTVLDLLLATVSMTNLLVSEMYALSELARFAEALEIYLARLEISMNCLKEALVRTGVSLEEIAVDFEDADRKGVKYFQQIEQYLGFDTPVNIPNALNMLVPVLNGHVANPLGELHLATGTAQLPWSSGSSKIPSFLSHPGALNLGKMSTILGGP